MTGSRVVALGHYQPAKVLTNEDLAAMVDTSDEWIRSRVGIETRHVAGPDEPVDELAAHAAAKALAAAGLAPADIDLVLVATSTAIDRSPEHGRPRRGPARHGLARRHGPQCRLRRASPTRSPPPTTPSGPAPPPAPWSSAPTRWPTSPTGPTAPPVCSSATARARPSSRRPPSEEPGIGPVLWGSVPEMGHAVRIEGTPPRFAQEGQSVYRWATTQLPPIARKVCERAGVTPEDLAAVVLHQANLRIIEPVAAEDRRGQRRDRPRCGRVRQHLGRLDPDGPLQAGRARRDRQSGDPVLLFGFGGNLSYAGQVIRCP